MSEERGTLEVTLKCWCTPPKLLTANSERQVARCDDCGCEVLVGLPAEVPRLRLCDPPEEPEPPA